MDEDQQLEADERPCQRHPRVMTALSCSACGTPICVDCAVVAAVGMKCPDCARLPRAARGALPVPALIRGAAGALAAAPPAALAWHVFAATIGWFTLIIAWFVGIGVAEAVRWASGGFRNPVLGWIAAAAVALGIASPLVLVLLSGGTIGPSSVWMLLSACIAATSAVIRHR